MTFCIAVGPGILGKLSGYVVKRDGMNSLTGNPRLASQYPTREAARESGRVGHHSDMGGSGFKGTVTESRNAYHYDSRRYAR